MFQCVLLIDAHNAFDAKAIVKENGAKIGSPQLLLHSLMFNSGGMWKNSLFSVSLVRRRTIFMDTWWWCFAKREKDEENNLDGIDSKEKKIILLLLLLLYHDAMFFCRFPFLDLYARKYVNQMKLTTKKTRSFYSIFNDRYQRERR